MNLLACAIGQTDELPFSHEICDAGKLSGVVLERHDALNWLARFEDADRDDVATPT